MSDEEATGEGRPQQAPEASPSQSRSRSGTPPPGNDAPLSLTLRRYRAIAVIGAVLYPLAGFTLPTGRGNAHDPMLIRLGLSAACVIYLIATYVSVDFRKRMDKYAFAIYLLISLHAAYTLYANRFSLTYILAFMIAAMAISIIIESHFRLIIFDSLMLLLSGIGLYYTDAPLTSAPVFATTVGSVMVLSYVIFAARLSIQKSLIRYTQDLYETQEQLRQSQKMEAVGLLAAGIAHEFNNIITGIKGHAELLREGFDHDGKQQDRLDRIIQLGDRAAAISKQLLAFTRQQTLQMETVNLNNVVFSARRMFSHLLGEDVRLIIEADPDLHLTRADRGSIQQVLLNLLLNAREAMPEGGSVTIKTANVTVDSRQAKANPFLSGGPYAVITVTDTGCGMDEETLNRAFEPFFTTREVGKGTGLGLSTAYGIVKQHNGHISASSEPGRGTSFTIYLPSTGEHGKSTAPSIESLFEPTDRGEETVLIVEDEAELLDVASDRLQSEGYKVLRAATPSEALRICANHKGPIDLLIADVILPEMNGVNLADQIHEQHPRIATLFMSGYPRETIGGRAVLPEKAFFIEKPFNPRTLSARVRSVLDKAAGRLYPPPRTGSSSPPHPDKSEG